MPNNGTSLTSLAERMKAKTEKESQEIETATREQFSALQRSLSESSKTALSTTESAILKSMEDLERTIISRCRILSAAFGKTCLQAATLTFIILLTAGLSGWGLISLFRYQATDLRREVAALQDRKETLEVQSAQIWSTFKGLEPYQAEGKNYLLTPEGWIISSAGTVGKREAWIIVRK